MPSIYLHIPFCVQKCRYCDFLSYAGKTQYIEKYVLALASEMHTRSGEQDWGEFDTVFLGGGTPSLLLGDMLGMLLETLRSLFSIAPGAEYSMECNPGTISPSKLNAYLHAGINRLSIGVQSMDDALLRRIGRIHTAQQAIEAFHMAKEAGFININADIMHGLPGQTELDYLSTIRDVAALSPTHISAYSLILEEHTPLRADIEKSMETLPPEEETEIMQDIGMALLSTHGYERYEISNFAKPTYACRHNINYWRNGSYLGIGAGAHSAWRLTNAAGAQWTRWENASDFNAYMGQASKPLTALNLKRISFKEEAFESVMLGLRMVEGISLSAFEERFRMPFMQMYPKAVEKLLQDSWLIIADGHARLTERGLDMQNAALQLFMD